MFNFKKYIISLLLLVSIIINGYSAFNELGVGSARIIGLGGAFSAVENKGEGALINPASITLLKKGSVTAMYSPLYLGLDDGSFEKGYFNVVYRFEHIGIFSINWEFLKTHIKAMDNLYNEDSFVLTYTRNLNKEFSVGARINYNTWQGAEQTDYFGNTESLGSSAFSIGLSGYYRVNDELRLGLSANNINVPRIDDDSKGKDDLERMPLVIQPGVCFYLKRLMFAIDIKYIYSDIDILIGSEYWFYNRIQKKVFGCRLGMNFPDLGNGFNATAGFSVYIWQELSFDYGFTIPITTITSIWGDHKFSLSYRW